MDVYSKFTWSLPIKKKSDAPETLSQLLLLIMNRFAKEVKVVKSDQGTEFLKLRSFLQKHGIAHELSNAHYQNENGQIERMIRTIKESARAILGSSGHTIPKSLWRFALQYVTQVWNVIPRKGLKDPHARFSPV